MSIGVRAHDFGRRPARDLARAIRAAGFDSLQLAPQKCLDSWDDLASVDVAGLRTAVETIRSEGLDISVFGCYVAVGHPEVEARRAAEDQFLRGLELAAQTGLRLVATETPKRLPGETREEAFARLLESCDRLLPQLQNFPEQVMALEIVQDHCLSSAEQALFLSQRYQSPQLGWILDPVNLLADGREDQAALYTDFVEKLGPELQALHLKDVVFESGRKVWRPLGQGIVDYSCLQKILPPERLASLPLLREHARPDCQLAEDLAFLQRFKAAAPLTAPPSSCS